MAKVYPQIRVFISSTFLDMQKEREILNQEVFPIVKGECDRLGVPFNMIDLRWGITEEDQAMGNVLELCLNEIQHCKPFFIGLIGNRYGTILKEYNSDLEDKFQFIKDNEDKSVTELEMILGALSEENRSRCFFFYKDPCLFDESTCDNHSEMIENLKGRIDSLNIRHNNYTSFEQFKELVLEELLEAVHIDYPEWEDIAEVRQTAYLNLQEFSNIERPAWNRQISKVIEYVETNHVAVAAYSEAMCGKTTTFNHLINQKTDADKIIINFEADTNMRYFPAHYLYNMISNGLYDYGYSIPDFDDYPEPEFLNNYESSILSMLSLLKKTLLSTEYKRPLYILINDAANQLFEGDESKTLRDYFLFDDTPLPNNLYIIITTNAEPTTPIKSIKLDPSMSTEASKEFFAQYLARFGKKIDKDILDIATPRLYFCEYKLIADYLIYYCNFSSYKKDSKELLTKQGYVEILTWIYDNFVFGMSSKCASVFTEILLRLFFYEPGLSEQALFDSYKKETALEIDLGYHMYVDLSEIEKATIMRALRYFSYVESGTIFLSNSYIKVFLSKSIDHLTEVLSRTNSERTRNAYEDFYGRLPQFETLHVFKGNQLWLKEDLVDAESAGNGSPILMTDAIFDPLCALLNKKLLEFAEDIKNTENAYNKEDITDNEVSMLVTIQETARLYSLNTRCDLYQHLLENVELMLFVCCKSHSLLKRLISNYIDLNINVHKTQFSHVDKKTISFFVNEAFMHMVNVESDAYPDSLIEDAIDIAIKVLEDYEMLDYDLLDYANDGCGTFTTYDFVVNACSEDVQEEISELECNSHSPEDEDLADIANNLYERFEKTTNAFDKILYSYYIYYISSKLIGHGAMTITQFEDKFINFHKKADELYKYCFFPDITHSIYIFRECMYSSFGYYPK